VHEIRYAGVFAPNASQRPLLTGQPKRLKQLRAFVDENPAVAPREPAIAATPPVGFAAAAPALADVAATSALGAPPPEPARARRLDWAELLRRVYRAEVLVCARCGGPMQLLAFLTDAEVVRRILAHLDLPWAPPPIAPARGPPQAEIFEVEGPALLPEHRLPEDLHVDSPSRFE